MSPEFKNMFLAIGNAIISSLGGTVAETSGNESATGTPAASTGAKRGPKPKEQAPALKLEDVMTKAQQVMACDAATKAKLVALIKTIGKKLSECGDDQPNLKKYNDGIDEILAAPAGGDEGLL